MGQKLTEKIKLPGWLVFVARLGGVVSAKAPGESPEDKERLAVYSRLDAPPRRTDSERRERLRQAVIDRRHFVKPRPSLIDHLASGSFVLQKMPAWSGYLKRLAVSKAHNPVIESSSDRRAESKPRREQLAMGGWGFYFLAKLGMFWAELIDFHSFANLLFAAFIFWSVSARLWRRVNNIVTIFVAVAMLYYDSWLPPIGRLISQASLLSEFNASYLMELLSRFISLPVVGALLAAGVLYWMVSRWLRTSVLVFICMLFVGLMQSPLSHLVKQGFGNDEKGGAAKIASTNLAADIQDFFDGESQRVISFVTPAADAVPFDVIFIHVCSLSWDDVRAVGLENHPLWARFDMLLTRFNSAASYSGPAAIHMLRATCGQQEHSKLYVPTAEKCYLMGSLQAAGFEPGLALNHDGKFDNFLDQVRTHGRLTVPAVPLDGVTIAQYAFDNSPVYDDLSVLKRWLHSPGRLATRRAALYYNTVSLHDGNHYPGTHAQPNTLKTYGERLSRFLNGIESIIQELERSDRRAVLVMIPEHGGAVRGDQKQIAGLREIPTPAISLVPVGIKVVGGEVLRNGDSVVIDRPTSYLAVSYIIERMLEVSPFAIHTFKPGDYTAGVPLTPFVAQNEKMTVAQFNELFYLSRNGVDWEDYAEFNQFADSR